MIKHWIPESAIAQTFEPDAALRGRGGGLRIRTNDLDIFAGGAYYPVRRTEAEYQDVIEKTSQQLTAWAEKTISSLPTRTTPLLAIDLNDGLGVRSNGTGDPVCFIDSPHVGDIWPQIEHGNSIQIRKLLAFHDLCALNTFHGAGPTFFGTEGHTSRPDYVLCPTGFRVMVKKHTLCQKLDDGFSIYARPCRAIIIQLVLLLNTLNVKEAFRKTSRRAR